MTTAAQVKGLVKPLLERHADLALVGRWIYVKPVHHFARGVLLDRVLDPQKFRPQYAAVHLFQWRRSFSLSWGEWLYNEGSLRPGSWSISDSDVVSALFREIETNALPVLRRMKTLDDYLTYVSRHHFRHQLFDWPECRIIVEIALGDLKAARTTSAANLALWSSDNPDYDSDTRQQHRRLLELCGLLESDDREGLGKLLHMWEAQTVKNLKIENLWQPTPFPIEVQAASA